MRRHCELPFGAEPTPDGVRFRLWVPSAHAVSLLLEDADLPMPKQPGGWWSLTAKQATAGSRYRYRVDGNTVPDPASRFQPDGVHAASEVVDPRAYRWGDTAWRGRKLEELAIYELHLGTFSERGDYVGAVAHLDDLVDLGVTAVELMPIAEFPGRWNWGYDGVQLYAPSSRYGRPDALKALVDACHACGLAILLDVVYNHFGPEGNYLHTIAPEFFTERHHTPWGAAINYDGAGSRPVRDFVVHNALYWLEEFHFDGLRLDAVHAIADDSTPDIIAEIAETVRHRITGREVHLFLENDRNEARRLVRQYGKPVADSGQWNDDLHHILHLLVTSETRGYYSDYTDRPIAHLGRALATGFGYQGEPSHFRDGEPRGEPSGDLPATAFVSFLQNHDQIGNTPFGIRIAEQAFEAKVHAAVTIVLLSPQIPMLFMGEEWASASPFLFFCDFAPPLDDAVRQGRRREFAQYREFSDPAVQQKIPDPTAEATFAASKLDWRARASGTHARWLDRYRRLLALRARQIAPRLVGIVPGGDYEVIGPASVRVEWAFGDASRLTLLANFADDPITRTEPTPRDMLYASQPFTTPHEIPANSAAFFLTRGRAAAL